MQSSTNRQAIYSEKMLARHTAAAAKRSLSKWLEPQQNAATMRGA